MGRDAIGSTLGAGSFVIGSLWDLDAAEPETFRVPFRGLRMQARLGLAALYLDQRFFACSDVH